MCIRRSHRQRSPCSPDGEHNWPGWAVSTNEASSRTAIQTQISGCGPHHSVDVDFRARVAAVLRRRRPAASLLPPGCLDHANGSLHDACDRMTQAQNLCCMVTCSCSAGPAASSDQPMVLAQLRARTMFSGLCALRSSRPDGCSRRRVLPRSSPRSIAKPLDTGRCCQR